jgi:hypothetical protein
LKKFRELEEERETECGSGSVKMKEFNSFYVFLDKNTK